MRSAAKDALARRNRKAGMMTSSFRFVSKYHFVGVLFAAAFAVACGDAGRGDDTAAATDSTPEPPAVDQGAIRGIPATDSGPPAGTLGEPGEGPRVAVVVRDGALTVQPDSIPAGPATFVIENRGNVTHRIEVRHEHHGHWIQRAMAPGGVGELRMPLTYGDFEVVCVVEDVSGKHAENGERAIVRVR
jgi:hypothetical protein